MVIPRIELLVTLRIELQGLLLGDVAIAVLPLGTGNDMARTLMCGGGYSGGNILPLLKVQQKSCPEIRNPEAQKPKPSRNIPPLQTNADKC